MKPGSVKIVDRVSVNKKTISVATDDGHQWNVAPGLLRLVQSAGDVQWP
jgi:hypothetical protein